MVGDGPGGCLRSGMFTVPFMPARPRGAAVHERDAVHAGTRPRIPSAAPNSCCRPSSPSSMTLKESRWSGQRNPSGVSGSGRGSG